MARDYDPAKEPCSPEWYIDPECYSIDGPGGSTVNRENNEKGILETNLFETINYMPGRSDLGADHRRVGIYAEGNTD